MRFRHCDWRGNYIFGIHIERNGLYIFIGVHSFIWERVPKRPYYWEQREGQGRR